jgi:hypothetical protein
MDIREKPQIKKHSIPTPSTPQYLGELIISIKNSDHNITNHIKDQTRLGGIDWIVEPSLKYMKCVF